MEDRYLGRQKLTYINQETRNVYNHAGGPGGGLSSNTNNTGVDVMGSILRTECLFLE